MTAATARRPAARAGTLAPLGTGQLHQALDNSRSLAHLHAFCAAHKCEAAQVSVGGIRLDLLLVLDLMRSRGYTVSEPTRPQHQPVKGSSIWTVNVTLPSGSSVQLGFQIPDTS